MSSSPLSFTLLVLFTSPERATSIVGDLTEEAQSRGRLWFWSQLIRTTGALWWEGLAQSPLAIARLVVAGGAMWLSTTVILVALELLFVSLSIPINFTARFILLAGALLTGLILGRVAPLRGMHASVVLALVAVPVLAVVLFPVPYGGIHDARLPYMAVAIALVPLGSGFSRRSVARL